MATAIGAWGEEYEVADTPEVETPVAETETTPEVNDVVTPTEVPTETVVETPAAIETPAEQIDVPVDIPDEVIAETPVIAPEPVIVEKYPDMDDYSKQLFEAIQNKDETAIFNYLNEKMRDYATMSDYDVVKINMGKANPTWTPEEVELELRYKYGDKLERFNLADFDKELDPDEYAEAVKHNKEVERNEILLKRDARDARITLEQAKQNIEFPKIKSEEPVQVVSQPTPEEIQKVREDWEALVNTEVPKLTEFKFKAGDEDVVYKITDSERTEQLAIMKNLNSNSLALELGWMDKDGKQNVQKIAGDVLKLKKFEKIIASAVTQAKTAATKDVVGAIKNIDLTNNKASSVEATQPDIGHAVWGHINPK